MLIYPQLGTGALSQYPVRKQHRLRTLVNTAADGTVVKLADPGAEITEWQLHYAGLSDAELAALLAFVEAAEGTLNEFTFVDPTANLLAWSGDLSNAVWSSGPFLTNAKGGADPAGGNTSWHVANSGAAAQSLTQTLAAPAGYMYAFSAYVRATATATVTALIGTSRDSQTIATDWSRIVFAASGDAAAGSILFGLELPAGVAIDVYGLQVEPQGSPSLYKSSSTGGVYEGARLGDDSLSFTTTGVNSHSATVNIIHASHL